MKTTTAVTANEMLEAAPSTASTERPAGPELSEEALDRILQKVSRSQENAELGKAGLQLEPILFWESTAQIPRKSRLIGAVQHSSGRCLCDKSLVLPEHVLPLDVIETCRGDHSLSGHGFRLLTEKEVSETHAAARSLQTGARIRRLQAQAAKPESDLRRVISEIANSKEIVKSINERVEALEAEKLEKEAAVQRAQAPLEEFFTGKSEAWKAAFSEAARTDRDALPISPPEKARAHFPPRLDGGKEFTINKATGELERVR